MLVFGNRAAFLNRHRVTHLIRPRLIMSLKLLGERHILTILRVFYKALHQNGHCLGHLVGNDRSLERPTLLRL